MAPAELARRMQGSGGAEPLSQLENSQEATREQLIADFDHPSVWLLSFPASLLLMNEAAFSPQNIILFCTLSLLYFKPHMA